MVRLLSTNSLNHVWLKCRFVYVLLAVCVFAFLYCDHFYIYSWVFVIKNNTWEKKREQRERRALQLKMKISTHTEWMIIRDEWFHLASADLVKRSLWILSLYFIICYLFVFHTVFDCKWLHSLLLSVLFLFFFSSSSEYYFKWLLMYVSIQYNTAFE